MWFENLFLIIDNITLVYLIISCLVFFVFAILASITFDKHITSVNLMEYFELNNTLDYMPVSLLVPAYNEELTICDTIDSLLDVDYNQYEIIVINDGSSDNLVDKIVDKYNLKLIYKPMKKSIETKDIKNVYRGVVKETEIILVDKENGGKADALNVGINYSKYPIFVAIDADSILEEKSIKNIITPFMRNTNTVAVGGNVKISNNTTIKNGKVVKIDMPQNIIIAFQIIEYLRSFLISRMTWDKMNMNLIISGAFGAFNKKVITEIGGYKTNTIGEDMELVMRIHKKYLENKEEYYIAYAPNAICYTQVPDSLVGLKSQRKRWQIGLIHSMSLHKNMFLNLKWFLAKIYFLFFEMITPVIELIGMIIIPISFLLKIINLEFLILYFSLIFVYGFVISLTSIILESYVFKEKINKRVMLKLAFLSILEPLGYRQLISIYRIYAFMGYKKNKHKWGNIKRTKNN